MWEEADEEEFRSPANLQQDSLLLLGPFLPYERVCVLRARERERDKSVFTSVRTTWRSAPRGRAS